MNVFEFVFPIVAMVGHSQVEPQEPQVLDIYGTAFAIGANRFVTANHVFDGATDKLQWGIGNKGQKGLQTYGITAIDTLPDLDLAILVSDHPATELLPWNFDQALLLASVFTLGFPHAYDQYNQHITPRAFKGHVVAGTQIFRLPSAPDGFELSFQCPKGLSGSPVCSPGEPPSVRGMVIANSTWATEKLSSSEYHVEAQGDVTRESIVERYDAMAYGVAIHASALRDAESELLGGTLFDYVKRIERP